MTDQERIRKKLFLHKASRPLFVNIPKEVKELLGVDINQDAPKGEYDYVHLFATRQEELMELAKANVNYAEHDALFWLSYPKLSGKIKSDIKRETTWEVFEAIGMRPVAQVSINETWSALRGRPLGKS